MESEELPPWHLHLHNFGYWAMEKELHGAQKIAMTMNHSELLQETQSQYILRRGLPFEYSSTTQE